MRNLVPVIGAYKQLATLCLLLCHRCSVTMRGSSPTKGPSFLPAVLSQRTATVLQILVKVEKGLLSIFIMLGFLANAWQHKPLLINASYMSTLLISI